LSELSTDSDSRRTVTVLLRRILPGVQNRLFCSQSALTVASDDIFDELLMVGNFSG
jgi:hypothetical protein